MLQTPQRNPGKLLAWLDVAQAAKIQSVPSPFQAPHGELSPWLPGNGSLHPSPPALRRPLVAPRGCGEERMLKQFMRERWKFSIETYFSWKIGFSTK